MCIYIKNNYIYFGKCIVFFFLKENFFKLIGKAGVRRALYSAAEGSSICTLSASKMVKRGQQDQGPLFLF